MSVMRPRAKRPHHRSSLNRLWSASCRVEPLEGRRLLTVNPVGSDFPINSLSNIQTNPVIAMDADGDYVVAWQSNGQDGEGYGIFAQLFNSAGVAQGNEIQVNDFTFNSQINPAVAMDAFGSFVVTWQSYLQDGSGYGVYAQRFDASGNKLGTEFALDTFTAGDQTQPAIAMDPAGNFIIAWTSNNNLTASENQTGIYASRFDAFGNPIGIPLFHVNFYTPAEQNEPAVAMEPDGEFVITWSSNGQDASGYGVYARRFDSNANAIGTEFAVGPNTSRPQRRSSVSMDDDANFVVAWQGANQSTYVRHFAADLSPTSNESVASIWTAATTIIQNQPKVKMDDDGNFIVVWSGPNNTGPNKGIFGIKFNPDLTVSSGEFQVNSNTANTSRVPSFALTDDGDIVVVWAGEDSAAPNNTEIFGRVLSDVAPTDTVSLTRSLATVAEEGATQSVFTLTRGTSTGDLVVRLTVTGTATGGALNDYSFTADPSVNLRTNFSTLLVTIPNGQTSIQFTVDHNDDVFVEGDETVIVTLNNSFTYLVNGGSSTGTVTIEDDDALGVIVEPTLLSITEGGSLTFSVSITAPPASDYTVNISKLGGGDADLTSNKTSLIFTSLNFATPQIVTISAAQDADNIVGQATFRVSAAGVADQDVLAVEADDEAAPTAATGTPDLVSGSDTGRSDTDNRTNLDNSTVGKALTFTVPNTIAGAVVKLYADGIEVGSVTATGTTTTITTTGARDLSEGNHVFTATQAELGKVTSTPSSGLTVAVDTVVPVITISPAGNQADPTNSLPLRFAVLSSDELWDLSYDDFVVTGSAGAQTLVLTGSNRTFVAAASGVFQSGTVVLNLPAGLAHDVAGNTAGATIIIDNSITYSLNQVLPPNGLPFTSLVAGKLTVNGTNNSDIMSVAADGDDVVATVNGNSFRFAASGVTGIEVYANDGNDRVTIGNGVIGTYVLGGNGNDSLTGGDGNDSLTGASGKDSLRGGAGNDRVAGGKHFDFVFGEDGDDRCYGDEATDQLDGGNGRDRMYGGADNDTMFGGNLNDTMYGDAGNDSMDGQNHNDRLFAGTGRDTLKGGAGNDNLFAADGSGEVDSLDGQDGTDGADSDLDDLLASIEFDIV